MTYKEKYAHHKRVYSSDHYNMVEKKKRFFFFLLFTSHGLGMGGSSKKETHPMMTTLTLCWLSVRRLEITVTVNGTQENRVGLPPENDNIFRFVDAVLKSFEDIKVPRMEKNICLNHGMTSRLTKHNIAVFFWFFLQFYSFTAEIRGLRTIDNYRSL